MPEFFVLNDKALVYRDNPDDALFGVLASAVDGPDLKNGPIAVVPHVDVLAPAGPADFDRFRVDRKGHFPIGYYRNPHYRGRDPDCMNVVACVSYGQPYHGFSGQPFEWVPAAGPGILDGLDKLGSVAGVDFYGYV